MHRFVFISDTHNKHRQLTIPECDFLIHSGDVSSMGYEHEINNFLSWFNKQPARYKIFIAGNHDWLYERNRLLAKSLIPKGIVYLEDEEIILDGFKLYGSPVQLEFCNWAFNKTEDQLKKYWKAIPDDTDILITHSPAYGILDEVNNNGIHLGSPSLYKEVNERLNLLIHSCGHIHSSHGTMKRSNILFINASNLNEKYEVAYKPVIVEIDDNRKIIVLQE